MWNVSGLSSLVGDGLRTYLSTATHKIFIRGEVSLIRVAFIMAFIMGH
jgi:hypothetical protein